MPSTRVAIPRSAHPAIRPAWVPAEDEARTITLSEAIELAAGESLAIDLQKEQVTAAKEKKKSTEALRLPTLRAKASLLVWNSEISFAQPCDPMEMGCPPSGVIELTVQPVTA